VEDSYEWKETHSARLKRYFWFFLYGIGHIAIVGLFLGLRPLDESCAFRCSRIIVSHAFFVSVGCVYKMSFY